MSTRAYLFASLTSLALVACGGSSKGPETPEPKPGTEGVAVLESRSGSAVTGEARFVDTGSAVEVTVNVAGATPGKHAVHVHQIGDCSSADAMSAGDHFNPGMHQHGAPGGPEQHIGDFGNLEVGEDGTGTLSLVVEGATLLPGAKSFTGRALIVHAQEDDFQTQPSGNSGDRVACGVIRSQEKPAAAP